jgi:hypothetical protein
MKKYKKIGGAEPWFCAISQIILLIVSIIAISYIIGEGVGLVSAQDPGDKVIGPNGETWEFASDVWSCIEGDFCDTVGRTLSTDELCQYFVQNDRPDLCEKIGVEPGEKTQMYQTRLTLPDLIPPTFSLLS